MTRQEKSLCLFYAVVSAVALVATWSNNIAFFMQADHGGLLGFIRQGYANPAAASLTNDLLLLGAACTGFMVVETRRWKIPHLWLYIVLSLLIAVSVMFPLFMIARERRLSALRAQQGRDPEAR